MTTFSGRFHRCSACGNDVPAELAFSRDGERFCSPDCLARYDQAKEDAAEQIIATLRRFWGYAPAETVRGAAVDLLTTSGAGDDRQPIGASLAELVTTAALDDLVFSRKVESADTGGMPRAELAAVIEAATASGEDPSRLPPIVLRLRDQDGKDRAPSDPPPE